MADVAASVVGLLGAVKTCIDLWDIIITAKRVNEDLDILINHLRTEQMRFLLWCQITGLCDQAAEVKSRTQPAHVTPKIGSVDLLLRSASSTLWAEHVESVMMKMCRILREVEKFLHNYNVCQTPKQKSGARLRPIRDKILGRQRMPLLEMQALANLSLDDENDASAKSSTFWDQITNSFKWTIQGKKDFVDHVLQLRTFNDGLREILVLAEKQRLQRWVESAMAATSMAELVGNNLSSAALEIGNSRAFVDANVRTLCRISLQRGNLRRLVESEGNWSVTDNVVDAVQTFLGQDNASLGRNIKFDIKPEDVHISNADGETVERTFGTYMSKPCVIEWRYFSSKLTEEGKTLLDYKVHLLAETLSSCFSVDSFSVLRCRGYMLQDRHRYGIVFDYPHMASTPITLRDRLASDLRNGIRRDLKDRFQLAARLARSLYQLFIVGWLHKNIRSSSVLLFDKADDTHHLPTAYLAGFGFSRRENSREGTEHLPSILKSIPDDKEWQLYVHPRRRAAQAKGGKSAERNQLSSSNMLFDAYGLGIMLLEIGLWSPVIKLCSRNMSVDDFQAGIADAYTRKLRFHMGEAYATVVHQCLEGNFEEELIQSEEGRLDEQLFLECFEQRAVTVLEVLSSGFQV